MATIEERIEKLEKIVEKHEAAIECARLIGRWCYLNNQHIKNKKGSMLELFAMKTPDVRVILGQEGGWQGPEKVAKLYGRREPPIAEGAPGGRPGGSRIGHLFLHPLASPYIEVAGDLKTAKGVWLSIGIETGSDKNGNLTPCWGWGAYGVDFIKEEGQWKIWHFHIYRIFRAPYDKSWTAYVPEGPGMPMFADNPPNLPPKDDSPYSADKEYVFKPDMPEPYETFDESTAY